MIYAQNIDRLRIQRNGREDLRDVARGLLGRAAGHPGELTVPEGSSQMGNGDVVGARGIHSLGLTLGSLESPRPFALAKTLSDGLLLNWGSSEDGSSEKEEASEDHQRFSVYAD